MKTKRQAKKLRRPGRISLGAYQFAVVEGDFRVRIPEVALATLYAQAPFDTEPIRLYWQDARKLAAWLMAFADWAEEQEGTK